MMVKLMGDDHDGDDIVCIVSTVIIYYSIAFSSANIINKAQLPFVSYH